MKRPLQRLVRERAHGSCEYCGIPDWAEDIPFQIDHIIAQQHAGRTTASNLSYCCLSCNKRKGPNLAGIDPKTRRLTKLFHPRRQSWSKHFEWQGTMLVGRTAIGRTTVQVLAINAPERVAVRFALKMEGEFPYQ